MTNFLNKALGGIIGAGVGLVLGPFALTGKLYSHVELDLLKESYGIDKTFRDERSSIYCGAIVFTPLALLGGLIYGPIRGAILGSRLGSKKSFFGVPKELFTYDANLSDTHVKQIPEKKLWFNSYRTFHARGVFVTAEQIKTGKLQRQYVATTTIAQGSKQDASPLATLPPELLAKISTHVGSYHDQNEKEKIARYVFSS